MIVKMKNTSLLIGVAIFSVLLTLLLSFIGFAFLIDNSENSLNETTIPLLTMIGGWVAGIGAIFAAIVALKIAENQIRHEHHQGAIRCIHHSLVIINDLRGRLCSVKKMLLDGDRPLIALKKNSEAIEKRYEALYDHEIYRYIPGHVADLITEMSGSFFGLAVLVEQIASRQNNPEIPPLALPTENTRNQVIESIEKLDDELDYLFTQFENARGQIID